MSVYTMISIFDYNYTPASTLGLYFHGLLLERTSGVPIQQALVAIPFSVAPEFLSES
jgi:hypothetical protein